jgi:hypothetical protein
MDPTPESHLAASKGERENKVGRDAGLGRETGRAGGER